ncbi:hypothetical protein [Riemerella anatipestifer]|uniref:hypothetical protein n=1 Tax=Riemerella anatipestifer TaxID=34085 RepID=UPI00129DFF00|nr:hypothetical protein [Riemerella anatipestifer]MRM82250.1 hypothetical protein [Riemerella anatipestifer]
MKSLFLFTLSLLVFSLCNGQEQQNRTNWKEFNLKEKVKYLSEITYDVVEENGTLQKGNLKDHLEYRFHEQGHKVEEIWYRLDNSSLKWTYKYDSVRKRIEACATPDDYFFTYKYDEQSNKTEVNKYIDGIWVWEERFKYDTQNNLIEAIIFHLGDLYGQKNYQYDAQGNRIEVNTYVPDGSLYNKKVYRYDEKGNEIEVKTYNSYGRLESKQAYQYQYDKQGNWIKKTEYEDNKPIQITEREIQYYQN